MAWSSEQVWTEGRRPGSRRPTSGRSGSVSSGRKGLGQGGAFQPQPVDHRVAGDGLGAQRGRVGGAGQGRRSAPAGGRGSRDRPASCTARIAGSLRTLCMKPAQRPSRSASTTGGRSEAATKAASRASGVAGRRWRGPTALSSVIRPSARDRRRGSVLPWLEVVPDQARRHPGPVGNRAHGRGLRAAFGDQLQGRSDQRLAPRLFAFAPELPPFARSWPMPCNYTLA